MGEKTFKIHQMVNGPFESDDFDYGWAEVKYEDEEGNFGQDTLYVEDIEDLLEMQLHLSSKFEPYVITVEEGEGAFNGSRPH